ncbi:MAG: nicotinate-nucleotide adenylyltransferase [Cyclobacteriaceae bacterium]|nr:nicotinate-nucleotide adenylyltransferase [Cyclobacteriaceae bacterium]MCH8514737.1 nicotinate-nucleotide adenylyltransferase [Cyclobacteriaceae bacterium]
MRVGLFFGSFNPIHVGHLMIANAAIEHTDLDQIWFVVSPQSPFKKLNTLAHEFDRFDMVKAAIDDNPNFSVSNIEFDMPKPSYTIDTLMRLTEKYPSYQFGLLMGGDNLKSLHKWKNGDQIVKQFPLYVYPRPGQKGSKTKVHESLPEPNLTLFSTPMLSISATYIRENIRAEKSIRYLVSCEVEDLIKNRSLYL